MQIQTRIENPHRTSKTPVEPRTAPRVITSMADLTWAVFMQRRRRARLRRRALEEALFPSR